MSSSLLRSLQPKLANEGFSICEPFRITSYNNLVTRYPLPTFNQPNPTGILIGNTSSFWPKFVAHLKRVGSIQSDPVDSFCQGVIEGIVKEEIEKSEGRGEALKYELRFYNSMPKSGKFVHVQTAGHVAGVAYYDSEIMWSVSSTYGLWFVFRAVLVIDAEFDFSEPSIPLPLLPEEVKMKMKKLTERAMAENWSDPKTLLEIRDSYEIGKSEWRYDGELLNYFYPIGTTKTEVLTRVLSQQ